MRWLVVAAIFLLIPAWRIVKRSGLHPALSLLLLLPVVNIVALWLFAFANWPALKPPTSQT